MTEAQEKAVRRHRRRARQGGLVRLEIQVPEPDAAMIREMARTLRGNPSEAVRLRSRLRDGLAPASGRSLREQLACDLPDEDFDRYVTRDRDFGRPVDL